MKDIFKIMNEKWNKATDEFRHIKIDDRIKFNYKDYIGNVDLENKTIIDYGCGGGHLGKYLFKEKKIKDYIGFDICDNSVKAAKKTLADYDAKIIKVKEHIDFSKYNADIFISFECIQHFPTYRYLLTFFESVNMSGIPELIIQIRPGRKRTFVSENVMTYMSKIPTKKVIELLNNYKWMRRKKHYLQPIKKESLYFLSKDSLTLKGNFFKDCTGQKDEIIGEGHEDIIIGGENEGY